WNDPRIFKVSFTDVLAMDQYRQAGEKIEPALAGHLVVVGSLGTGSNISDVGATPLAHETYLVSLHWNVANSLLMGRFIRPPSMALELGLIVLMGLFAGWVTWTVRPVLSTLLIAAALGGFTWLAASLFVQHRIWLPLVSPLGGGLLLTHLAMVTCRVVVERREQRRVRSLFSKVVAPDVVRELLAQPSIHLGGSLRPVTVMFADVRGFTRMTDEQERQARERIRLAGAEGPEAERILADHAARTLDSVNEVLAAVADRVKEFGGTLDKYIGDCVMAFWGAPVTRDNQAAACVRAAIEAQRTLARINERRHAANEAIRRANAERAAKGEPPEPLQPELSLGIGIHSGVAVVGLMGSENHILNYTVFGREVNLASRLEGVAERDWIVISEATFRRLEEEDPALARRCEPLPPATVKGIAGKVAVYRVRWNQEPDDTPPAGT
ncbi:MAG: CHASE2 domain-containing protein, partial [Verrucomicrobia bacterium]